MVQQKYSGMVSQLGADSLEMKVPGDCRFALWCNCMGLPCEEFLTNWQFAGGKEQT